MPLVGRRCSFELTSGRLTANSRVTAAPSSPGPSSETTQLAKSPSTLTSPAPESSALSVSSLRSTRPMCCGSQPAFCGRVRGSVKSCQSLRSNRSGSAAAPALWRVRIRRMRSAALVCMLLRLPRTSYYSITQRGLRFHYQVRRIGERITEHPSTDSATPGKIFPGNIQCDAARLDRRADAGALLTCSSKRSG